MLGCWKQFNLWTVFPCANNSRYKAVKTTHHVHRTFRDVIRVPLAPSAGGGAGGGVGGGGAGGGGVGGGGGVKKQGQSFVF